MSVHIFHGKGGSIIIGRSPPENLSQEELRESVIIPPDPSGRISIGAGTYGPGTYGPGTHGPQNNEKVPCEKSYVKLKFVSLLFLGASIWYFMKK
jgi:hypothetical protein